MTETTFRLLSFSSFILHVCFYTIFHIQSFLYYIKGMLRPIFCIDINTHSDRKWKIIWNLFKKAISSRSNLFCNTSATRMRHQCDTSATRTTRVRHGWEILILITKRVKTYFHTPDLAIWQMKPQKLNFVMAKVISKSYALDCSCKCSATFPHSYA